MAKKTVKKPKQNKVNVRDSVQIRENYSSIRPCSHGFSTSKGNGEYEPSKIYGEDSNGRGKEEK